MRTIQHFPTINLHLSVNMNQRELSEDDYPQGFLASKLLVERISVDASYLYCSICGVNVPTNNIIS